MGTPYTKGLSSLRFALGQALSEAKDLALILRFTQDDKAVLPVALWPTRAHARLRLMRIGPDLSRPTERGILSGGQV